MRVLVMDMRPQRDRYTVEVFPLANDHWVALIWDSRGEFVIDLVAPSPQTVVIHVTTELPNYVTGPNQLTFVDDVGRPWDPAMAESQLRRLDLS